MLARTARANGSSVVDEATAIAAMGSLLELEILPEVGSVSYTHLTLPTIYSV